MLGPLSDICDELGHKSHDYFIVDEKLIINYIKQACPQCLHTDKEDG